MSSSQTLLDNLRRPRDAASAPLSITERAVSDGAYPNARREASHRSIAGVASDFSAEPHPSQPAPSASGPIHDVLSDTPSIGKRIRRTVVRYCIAILVGVGATLAWQSHGDVAKGMVIAWVPPLGWLLSDSTKSLPNVDDAQQATHATPTLATNTSATAQQLAPVMLELADMRRSVEVLAAKQEQLAQNIASLQAVEQQIRQNASSASPSRTVPVPPRKPPLAAAPTSPEQSTAVQSSSVFPPPPVARAASPSR